MQWFDLLNRWLLSSLDTVYDFTRAGAQDTVRELPPNVLSELMLNVALAPLWQVNLYRGWHDELVATDASPSYGFGVAVAPCLRSTVRLVGRSSHEANSHIRFKREANDPKEQSRSGAPLRLDMTLSAFQPVLSKRASHVGHSGGMEAHALALGMRWLTRWVSSHCKRVVFLVDALALKGAGQKGRTSAPTLRTALRRCAAFALACDWQTHLAYVPSESNAADWPSRGLCRKQVAKRYMGGVERANGKVKKTKMSKPVKRLYDFFLITHERRTAWLDRWCAAHLHDVGATATSDSADTEFSSNPYTDECDDGAVNMTSE